MQDIVVLWSMLELLKQLKLCWRLGKMKLVFLMESNHFGSKLNLHVHIFSCKPRKH